MTEVRFYHLQSQTLEQALPKLLLKAYGTQKSIIVRASNSKDVEAINQNLWTFHPNAFLPHGSKKDGNADLQPIWLTEKDDNPNNAKILVLTNSAAINDDIASFDLCCDMFNGFDETEVASARKRWKTYKDAGHEITYWQQSGQGAWEQKA